MARTSTPPRTAPAAPPAPRRTRPPRPSPGGGDSPAAAVLAALSAGPAGAAVAVIAGHAGPAWPPHGRPCSRTRRPGPRPGSRAACAATPTPGRPPRQQSRRRGPARRHRATGRQAGGRRPARPDPAGGTAEGGEAEAGPAPGPDPTVTAQAAGTVLAIAQAAYDAGEALAAGDLDAALAALDAAREQAAQGRRVIKAAASGGQPGHPAGGALATWSRRTPPRPPTPASPRGRSAGAGAVGRRGRNALDKLTALGTAQMVTDKPRSYRLAPAPALGRGSASPDQRGGHAQRRVTRGRDGNRMPPRPRRLHVYLPYTSRVAPGRPPGAAGRSPFRRTARPPLAARYISGLTCIALARYMAGTREVQERITGGTSDLLQQPHCLPLQHLISGGE